MARIIHVEDEAQWIDVVRRALGDHEVDSARTWEQALALLHGPVTYDLALIDLNLSGDSDDKEGGELLDLLRVDFPATRRVVITAVPPAGDLRSRIYERYGVEDMIIKDKTTVPDLQLVVRRALRRDSDEAPYEANLQASELRERYQDWRAAAQDELRTGQREAETNALHWARQPGRSAEDARRVVAEWKSVHEQFAAECERLEGLIAAAKTHADVDAAAGELDEVMSSIAAKVKEAGAPGRQQS